MQDINFVIKIWKSTISFKNLDTIRKCCLLNIQYKLDITHHLLISFCKISQLVLKWRNVIITLINIDLTVQCVKNLGTIGRGGGRKRKTFNTYTWWFCYLLIVFPWFWIILNNHTSIESISLKYHWRQKILYFFNGYLLIFKRDTLLSFIVHA